jgi:hypothetical protein
MTPHVPPTDSEIAEAISEAELVAIGSRVLYRMPEVYDDCARLVAEVRIRGERIAELEDEVRRLREALSDCGTHAINADTCGVCGEHFAFCESDLEAFGDIVDENGIPRGRRFACPGARARALLEKL